MPRDWMREEREREERREWDRRRELREPGSRDDFGRDDFGLGDFSEDYAYDPDRREGYRLAADEGRRAGDYGQADYSSDYADDPERGRGYRRFTEDDRGYDADPDGGRRGPGERSRSWAERAEAFFTGRDDRPRRRRGPSDRVLWAVIVERLEDERGLDLRDVEVLVDDAEVTLNGTVRRKEDKRRIEDLADLEGVRHVQNNLRVREPRRWFG